MTDSQNSANGDSSTGRATGRDSNRGGDTLLDVGRGGVVTAKGTSEGLVLRIDSRTATESLAPAVEEFVEPRKKFLAGHEVSVEWIGGSPDVEKASKIKDLLAKKFKVIVKDTNGDTTQEDLEGRIEMDSHSSTDSNTPSKSNIKPFKPMAAQEEATSLFDGFDSIGSDGSNSTGFSAKFASDSASSLTDPLAWDDPDARVVFTTLRSGQKIETEHSLIIIGDINPGAEVVAGGDIVVLGSLRGIAHAGAYEETGGGRAIFAINLRPTQLRIGTTISRGSEEKRKAPEVARVEGNIIVVEPYSTKCGWVKELSGM